MRYVIGAEAFTKLLTEHLEKREGHPIVGPGGAMQIDLNVSADGTGFDVIIDVVGEMPPPPGGPPS